MIEREKLLRAGESALAKLHTDAASQAFEGAALMAHSADSKIGLVRTYMQSGAYRRALAFCAHTAGAHLDAVEGVALYVWLSHMGGQASLAQRLLLDADARVPGNSVLKSVQRQLRSGKPKATPDLLVLPYRMAPYGTAKVLPSSARVAGSGLVLQDGKHALVPLNLVPRSGKLRLRNGLGQLVDARLEQPLTGGVALLSLSHLMPTPGNMVISGAMAFPGSVGFVVEYAVAVSVGSAPAWPLLRSGFLGGVSAGTDNRKFGIDMPVGPRDGPVFDAAGRLVGLALSASSGTSDRLVSISELVHALRLGAGQGAAVSLSPTAPAGIAPTAAVDMIYETSLKTALQVITAL